MKPHLADCDIIIDQIIDDDIYDIPPWELASPSVNFKIHSMPKSEKLESDYKHRFNEIKDLYESMQFGSVYTDGSKSNDYVSASAVSSVDILKVCAIHSTTDLEKNSYFFQIHCHVYKPLKIKI